MVHATQINDLNDLDDLNAVQLRELLRGLIARAGRQQRVIEAHDQIIATKDREIHFKQTKVDQLTHEIAMLRRWKFAARSERLNAGQHSLLDETLDADIAAIEQELEQLSLVPATELTKQVARRALLPAHLPLYRQESIFGRAGFAISRSTMGAWVGMCGVQLQPLVDALKVAVLAHGVLPADETPVAMRKPGQGKTHRAYLWTCAPAAFENLRAVIYDFTESRAGSHARDFLRSWRGSLVCDDFSGYKASFALGVTETGCLAHARRKFVDLQATGKSLIAETVEREVRALDADERQRIRQVRARP